MRLVPNVRRSAAGDRVLAVRLVPDGRDLDPLAASEDQGVQFAGPCWANRSPTPMEYLGNKDMRKSPRTDFSLLVTPLTKAEGGRGKAESRNLTPNP